MLKKTIAAVGTIVIATAVACDKSNAPVAPSTTSDATVGAAADGSTLKIAAPALISPADGFQAAVGSTAPIVFTVSNVSGTYTTFPVTYEIELRNAAGTVIANPKFAQTTGSSTSFTNTATLTPDTAYTWRARATYSGAFGPWSSTFTFRTTAFSGILPNGNILDPLTNGQTAGFRRGGRFVAGGWQAITRDDGIDYRIDKCASCTVDFDATNFGVGVFEDLADLKWFSMNEASAFSDFYAFRDNPWKVQLERRSDGDGTGLKIVWRNGVDGLDDRIDSGLGWTPSKIFHFTIDWNLNGFTVSVDGITYFQKGFGGNPYTPPTQTMTLGCWPRSETIPNIIYSNVKVTRK